MKMKKSKLVIGLYIIAGLLGIVTIYMLISSIAYLNSYVQAYGVSITDLGEDAFSYIMSNSASYLIYGILVFAAAKILDEVRMLRCRVECCGCASAECDEAVEQEADAAEPAVSVCTEIAVSNAGKVPPIYTSKSFIRY